MWRKEQIQPKYPDLDPLAREWRAVLESVGMFSQGFNGPAPITWPELAAWAGLTGAELLPWAAEAVIHASRAFCGEYSSSHEVPGAPMPMPVQLEGVELERAEAWARRRLS